MSQLKKIMERRILNEGPMSLVDFMTWCLGHPKHGYYITRDPFGKKGDFTTAPEISQIFGELIGAWTLQAWLKMGKPKEFNLVELGPGRGTLMADALRAASQNNGFINAMKLYLLETSPVLRKRQKANLKLFKPTHISKITELKKRPTIFLANEFFDAMPIKQFIWQKDSYWHERKVSLKKNLMGHSLCFIADTKPAKEQPALPPVAKINDIYELSPVIWGLTEQIASLLNKQGGYALVIDYGHTKHTIGETLKAVKNHRECDLFKEPGHADISAHVDFHAMAKIATQQACKVWGVLTQQDFLNGLGGDMRLKILCSNHPKKANELQTGYDRLTDPEQMGTLFKVLCFGHANLPNLEPFHG